MNVFSASIKHMDLFRNGLPNWRKHTFGSNISEYCSTKTLVVNISKSSKRPKCLQIKHPKNELTEFMLIRFF